MQALVVEQTEFTPYINFNPSTDKFEIRGESRPENSGKFYSKLISWISDFQISVKSNPSSLRKDMVFEFKFDYFNSTSAKFILDFLRQLEVLKLENPQLKITIKWYFDERDEDMRDSGEEFSHLVKLPFEFVTL